MNDSTLQTKLHYVCSILKTAGDTHQELLDRIFSEDKHNRHSFIVILRELISDEKDSFRPLDISWAYLKIVQAADQYIRGYYAPASTKQRLHDAIYSLCKSIGEQANLANFNDYLADLSEPVSADLTIDLIKALHDRDGITKEEFAAKHKVDPKTVQNYIQALSGNPKYKPLRIAGFTVHVPIKHHKEISSRKEKRRYYTPNTMNPVIYQLNTTQAVTLLKSLYFYNEQTDNIIPFDMAIDTWCQLSDYTKNRIRVIFCKDDPKFSAFLDEVESEAESLSYHFMSESEMMMERDVDRREALMIAFKSRMICDLELNSPIRSRRRQIILYDHDRQCYYAVSADKQEDVRLYFTKEEVSSIVECL